MSTYKIKRCISYFIDLHHLTYLRTTRNTVTQLVLLHTTLTRNVMLTRQENTVTLSHLTKHTFVALLFLSLTVCLT